MKLQNNCSYLVKDWAGMPHDDGGRPGEPKVSVVFGDAIFEVVAAAKETGAKIAVFALGECLLDWS